MSVFDPFHHDHINTPVNTPLITPLELQMVGGCRMKTGGEVITPLGVWINHCIQLYALLTVDLRNERKVSTRRDDAHVQSAAGTDLLSIRSRGDGMADVETRLIGNSANASKLTVNDLTI